MSFQLTKQERDKIAHDEGECPDYCDMCAKEKNEMAEARRKEERENGKGKR